MSNNIQRKEYLDMMRIIAIFFVLFNHCPGYELYQISEGGKTWLYMFATMVTRINVPLFFMVSGALLLGKNESYKILLKKRFVRFGMVVFVFSLCKYLENICRIFYNNGEWIFSCKDYIRGTLYGGLEGSYWFLYAYLGMILTLPFLRKICSQITKEDIIMLLGVHFVFSSLLPMLNLFLSIVGIEGIAISDHLSIPLSSVKALFYPIIGYYIEHYVDIRKINNKDLNVILSVAILGILLSCICTYYEGINSGYTQNYVQLFDYVTAICAYVVIKKLYFEIINRNGMRRRGTYISLIGSLTFGMYLLDPFLKGLFYNWLTGMVGAFLPVILTSVVWCVFSMILGGMLTYVMKQIPILKKLI